MGHDLLEDLVAEEVRLRERIVAIDDDAVLMAPYGSRGPFQLMLAPRRPRPRFEDDGPTGAALLHDGLRRLARHLGCNPPLNLWVRTAPRGAEHFCWRIDVLPRLDAPRGPGALDRGQPQHRRPRGRRRAPARGVSAHRDRPGRQRGAAAAGRRGRDIVRERAATASSGSHARDPPPPAREPGAR